MAAGNTYVALATQTLSSAASSVTFSSIPQGYTDLVIITSANISTSTANILLRTGNGSVDTGTNYSNTFLYGSGTGTQGGGGTTNQTSAYIGAATSSSVFALSTISLQGYSNTITYKRFLSQFSWIGSAVYTTSALWRSTAAIDTLTLTTDGANFNAGSTFSIYGILAA